MKYWVTGNIYKTSLIRYDTTKFVTLISPLHNGVVLNEKPGSLVQLFYGDREYKESALKNKIYIGYQLDDSLLSMNVNVGSI